MFLLYIYIYIYIGPFCFILDYYCIQFTLKVGNWGWNEVISELTTCQ